MLWRNCGTSYRSNVPRWDNCTSQQCSLALLESTDKHSLELQYQLISARKLEFLEKRCKILLLYFYDTSVKSPSLASSSIRTLLRFKESNPKSTMSQKLIPCEFPMIRCTTYFFRTSPSSVVNATPTTRKLSSASFRQATNTGRLFLFPRLFTVA